MDNEQELLKNIATGLRLFRDLTQDAMEKSQPAPEVYPMARQILAKLKAVGYEQVWKECAECEGFGYLPNDDTGEPNPPVGGVKCLICKGTGKITKYVKWDRDIVFSYLRNYGMAQISQYKEGKYYIPDDDAEVIVDQLKEILTGGS